MSLSVLPWLDNVIWHSKELIGEVLRGNYWALWMRDGWPMVGQIQSILLLLLMLFLDELYLCPDLISLRGVLLIATLLVMRGVGPCCISLLFFALGIALARSRWGLSMPKLSVAIIGLIAFVPLFSFYPSSMATIAILVLIYIMVRQATVQTIRRYTILFLALSMATIVWTALA